VPDGIEEVGGKTPQGFNMEMYKSGIVDGRMRERADWQESGVPCWSKHIRVCRRLKSAIPYWFPLVFSVNLTMSVSQSSRTWSRESRSGDVAQQAC
jgi:hypothetical protein